MLKLARLCLDALPLVVPLLFGNYAFASSLDNRAQDCTRFCDSQEIEHYYVSNITDDCFSDSYSPPMFPKFYSPGNTCATYLIDDLTSNVFSPGFLDNLSFGTDSSAAGINRYRTLGSHAWFFSGPSFEKATPPTPPKNQPVTITWDNATLRLSPDGSVLALINNHTGENYAAKPYRFVRLETDSGIALSTRVSQTDDKIAFQFSNGDTAEFKVTSGPGHSWWDLVDYVGDISRVKRLRMGTLNLAGAPKEQKGTLNVREISDFVIGVMATEPNVRASELTTKRGNKDGVAHTFRPEKLRVKQGDTAAVFSAQSDRTDNLGFSIVHRPFHVAKDLSGMVGYRIWVYGDQSCVDADNANSCTTLKIQLKDRHGRYLDKSRKIDFAGWKQIELNFGSNLTTDRFDLSQVIQLSFYFNTLMANSQASIVIDSVRAMTDSQHNSTSIMLEDFEDEEASFWDGLILTAQSYQKYGIQPAGFAVIGTPVDKIDAALEALETVSRLPLIVLNNEWAKQSTRVKNSYLLIHKLTLSEVDNVIEWARRGGFDTILIGADWSKSLGHHYVDPTYFPDADADADGDGLESLKLATAKIHKAGLRVGLHVLAAAVDIDDPYVTANHNGGPVAGIYTGEAIGLRKAISVDDDFIPTTKPPLSFPETDGGYNGRGTYLLINDEIVKYESLSLQPPYGFKLDSSNKGDRLNVGGRGELATKVNTHSAGTTIRHLPRPYGYFLHDLHSKLSQDVANNFCRVANAVDADMVYLDGAERLQGGSEEHWYYNARLIAQYQRCLDNKNTLLQASSYSRYAWHFLARQAAGDFIDPGGIKNYIDRVIANRYADFESDLMPIDTGWYFAIKPQITPDQIEYLLNKSLGYDSSISLSTYANWPRVHPEHGRIFDLVSRYEQLRHSGKVPELTRQLLRKPGREYRLTTDPIRLSRVHYSDWLSADLTDDKIHKMAIDPIASKDCVPGMEIRVKGSVKPGQAYLQEPLLTLEDFARQSDIDEFKLGHSSNVGISSFDRIGSCPGKNKCVKFSAKVTSSEDPKNHAVAQRVLGTALDVSGYQGIGLWLFGDGNGGTFKLQLRQGPWSPTVPFNDYVIENNFIGWRYFQLDQPTKSRGELTSVKYLALYWNNIPANREVTVYIDDIRVLAKLDPPALRNPSFSVGEQTVSITGDLNPGERMVYFPGQNAKVMPSRPGKPRVLDTVGRITVPTKAADVQITAEATIGSTEIRTVLSCSEHLKLAD